MVKPQKLIAWALASANIAVILYGLLFYIPAFAISKKTLERYVANGNVDQIINLASSMIEANSSVSFYFLPCFVLMLFNAILLLLLARRPSEK